MEDKFFKDGGSYKEYKIGKLFEIKPTKAYKLTNVKLFQKNGTTPVVTNSSMNNGITGYSILKPTEKGNMITYSDTTTSEGIFYQPVDFIGYSHIQGLYPLNNKDKWNEKTLLYFLSLFKKCASGRFSYSNKFNRKIAAEMMVKMPVKNQKIDFDFMFAYISELEEERISELEEERISELATYLSVSGLDNYKLSSEELLAINNFRNKKVLFKDFKISELFNVHSSKMKFNANTVKFGSGYPYVARGSSDNGIRGYIDENVDFLNPKNTISFGQDTATVYYQEKPYFTGDKIKIMEYLEKELDEELANYLVCAIRKAFSMYSWGQTSFSEPNIKKTLIKLPINSDNNIDYTFIKHFIKAQEKLAIKSVVDFKDRIINETRNVIK